MSNIVGYVKNMDGKYYAKGEKGKIRKLKEGDPIYQNDVVFGDETNAGESNIEIALWDGGKLLLLAGNDPLNVDSTLLRTALFSNEDRLNVDDLQNSIQKTNENLGESALAKHTINNQINTITPNKSNPITQTHTEPVSSEVSFEETATRNPVKSPDEPIVDVLTNVSIDPFNGMNKPVYNNVGIVDQNPINLLTPVKNATVSLTGSTSVHEGDVAQYEVVFPSGNIPSGNIEVHLQVTNNNAENADYVAISNTFSIVPNAEGRYFFSIPIVNDNVYEGSESYTITLLSVKGGGLDGIDITGNNSLTTHITDDTNGSGINNDNTAFSIGDVSISEGGLMSFTVTRTGDAETDQTVDFTTSIRGGDSAESNDFTAVSGTLIFSQGETSKTFTVQTSQDTVYEGSETFSVTLSNNSAGSTIANATAAGTILDDGTGSVPGGGASDNDTPSMSIGNVTVEEGSGAVFAVTVTAAEAPYKVSFNTTTNGSAEAGDITTPLIVKDSHGTVIAANLDGSYTVPAGETSLSVTVPTVNDNVYEGTETFELNGRTEFMNSDVSATGTITDTITDSVSTNEDSALTLTTNDFGSYSDADPLVSIKIITLPATGSLTLNGAAVSENQVISKADIDAGKLVFTPVSQSDMDTTIQFQVNDGTHFSTTSTTTINVIAVADTPTVNVHASAYTGTYIDSTTNIATVTSVIDNTDSTQMVNAITGVKYAMSFNYLDQGLLHSSDSASGQLHVYWGGDLVATIDGNNTMSQTATLELIGGSGDGSNALTFQQSGTTSDVYGIAVDTIMMAPIENMLEYSVDVSGALGADNSDGSETLSITLSGLPDGATLAVGTAGNTNGTWVIPINGTSINLSNIKMYVPESADTFTLTAIARATETNDNGSGTNFAEATATATVTDVSLNAAPTSTNDSVTGTEDTTYVFSKNDFGTYSDDSTSDFTSIMITSLPTHGTLHLLGHDAPLVGGVAQDFVTAGMVVTMTDLNLGNLIFVPNANYSGTDTIQFRVSDGRAWSDNSYTTSIGVTAVADTPTITLNIGTAVDESSSFSDTDAFSSDLEGWSGTGITRTTTGAYANTMFIPHANTATKTFDLGIANAGKTVTIQFSETAQGGMESSGTSKDYLVLKQINTVTSAITTIANYTDSSWNGSGIFTKTLTYSAVADANGKVQLSLNANSSGAGEDFNIDNFSVSCTGATLKVYPITITNLLSDTDGSESLSDVTLSGIPSGASLYANGTVVTVSSGSADITQAQITAGNIVLKIPSTDSQVFTLNATVHSTEVSNSDTATAPPPLLIMLSPTPSLILLILRVF